MNHGQIVQCIGAVVDIQFPRESMPKVYDALVLQDAGDSLAEPGLTFEVQQQLGDGVVRTIALGSSDGLRRGLMVSNTGAAMRLGYIPSAVAPKSELLVPQGSGRFIFVGGRTFQMLYNADQITVPVGATINGVGDVNNDGSLTQADKDAFIAGWLSKRVVNGVQVGDMLSRAQGDLNLDGITNIQDLLLIQNALPGAGIGSITAADLGGVPEPATISLIVLGMLALPRRSSRRAR